MDPYVHQAAQITTITDSRNDLFTIGDCVGTPNGPLCTHNSENGQNGQRVSIYSLFDMVGTPN